ncbi:MAG TPA: hypothetical protein VMU50_07930 [Polyangia bacterium]|nr:hypothetical protein [Polyangia bacterium]
MASFSVGVVACSGGEGAPNVTAGSGGTSATGGSGSGGMGGGSGESTGGSPGTGGATPIDGGSSGGTNGGTDGGGSGGGSPGDGGTTTSMRRHGKSAGCGMAPVAGGTVTIQKCMGCSAAMGDCPRDCIAPEFAPRAAGGPVDFTMRPFTLRAPAGYNNMTAYPLLLGGGTCGSGGGGYDVPGDNGIHVNLAIHNGNGPDGICFADGGQACSGDTTHLAYCVNSPEIPYVRAILAWVEAHYCVDLDKEFIIGASSGAWEAYTNGCGNADQLRGFMANAGGKREHRWPCNGPIAAYMIANTGDGMNPITTGGLEPHLDSHGSSAARDELLVRNGCTGGVAAGTQYSPQYPKCIKYNCPAAYPVVWCALGGGHTNTNDGGVNYAAGVWPFFMSLPASP